jgi:hypothetical protein
MGREEGRKAMPWARTMGPCHGPAPAMPWARLPSLTPARPRIYVRALPPFLPSSRVPTPIHIYMDLLPSSLPHAYRPYTSIHGPPPLLTRTRPSLPEALTPDDLLTHAHTRIHTRTHKRTHTPSAGGAHAGRSALPRVPHQVRGALPRPGRSPSLMFCNVV